MNKEDLERLREDRAELISRKEEIEKGEGREEGKGKEEWRIRIREREEERLI